MTFDPDYVPTGPNNKANEYYKKINHVRLAKIDSNKREFFGTVGGIGGGTTAQWTIEFQSGFGAWGFDDGNFGPAVGDLDPRGPVSGTTVAVLTGANANCYFRLSADPVFSLPGANAYDVTAFGTRVQYRQQGAALLNFTIPPGPPQIVWRDLVQAAAGTTVPVTIEEAAWLAKTQIRVSEFVDVRFYGFDGRAGEGQLIPNVPELWQVRFRTNGDGLVRTEDSLEIAGSTQVRVDCSLFNRSYVMPWGGTFYGGRVLQADDIAKLTNAIDGQTYELTITDASDEVAILGPWYSTDDDVWFWVSRDGATGELFYDIETQPDAPIGTFQSEQSLSNLPPKLRSEIRRRFRETFG